MIGFFDSGFGGLTILREVTKELPEYSYIYLGDNARTPYGSHSKDIIYTYTLQGVEELFRRGCELVVIACNTSSAVALRRLQQEFLPASYPDRRILGIIIPTAEGMLKDKAIGIFATEATVKSNVFPIEINKHNPHAKIIQQACPLLVPIIESGELDQASAAVNKYVKQLLAQEKKINTVILGCTHYGIIEDVFRNVLPQDIVMISQGRMVSAKLQEYLKKHSELESKLAKSKDRIFLTTENSAKIKRLAQKFYGQKINLEIIKI